MRRDNIRLIGFIQVILIFTASAYEHGAPEEACSNMSPEHGYSSQTTLSPYTISMSSSSYYPGQTITVTINGSDFFKGVILQARRAGNKSKIPEGWFNRLPETLQYLTCNNVSNSTVTHRNSSEKQLIELDWVAPQEFVGKIKFYATIVHNTSTYWKKVKSTSVREQHTETTEVPSVTDIIDSTSIPGATNLPTTEHSTTDWDDHGNEEYVETSPPDVFRSTTLAALESTDSLSSSTTPIVLSTESPSSRHVDDVTIPATKPIGTEMSASPNSTLPMTTDTDVPSPEFTTFNYSVSSNLTIYPYNQSNDYYVTENDVTDEVRGTHITASEDSTMTSTTEDYTTIDVTDEARGIQITASEGSTITSKTEDYTTIDRTKTNSDVTTIGLDSTAGISNSTNNSTFSTQATQPTDYDFLKTRLPDDTVSSALPFRPNNITELNTTDSHTESEQSTDLSTTGAIQDYLTDLAAETSYTTSYDLTGNYSQLTEPTASTNDVTNEGRTGERVPMVTDLVDTSVFFKMTITSIEFTDSMMDRTSKEFNELSDDIQKTMEDLYSTWEEFRECRIVEFTQGSVITETELVFQTPLSEDEQASTVDVLYSLVEETGGIGNYSVSDIQAVGSEGTYVLVDPCFLLPCPADLYCYVEESKCILSCEENTDFCPNGECTEDDSGRNLTCNVAVTTGPNDINSNELVIAMVLIGASVFLIVVAFILSVFICKLWKRKRLRRRRQADIQMLGFEDNRHIRLNGGVPIAEVSGSRGRYFVEIAEPNETPFFSRHPTNTNLSGRGSIGSVDQHSVFDRAFSSAAPSDLDEHDYDYDVINRNRSVRFSETPQFFGDDQSAEAFGIENFSFGVPKYVDREDGGGSYKVRWDFKVDDPDSTDMDIAL